MAMISYRGEEGIIFNAGNKWSAKFLPSQEKGRRHQLEDTNHSLPQRHGL